MNILCICATKSKVHIFLNHKIKGQKKHAKNWLHTHRVLYLYGYISFCALLYLCIWNEGYVLGTYPLPHILLLEVRCCTKRKKKPRLSYRVTWWPTDLWTASRENIFCHHFLSVLSACVIMVYCSRIVNRERPLYLSFKILGQIYPRTVRKRE